MNRLGLGTSFAARPICCLGPPLLVAAIGGVGAALIGGTLVGAIVCAVIFIYASQRKRLRRGESS